MCMSKWQQGGKWQPMTCECIKNRSIEQAKCNDIKTEEKRQQMREKHDELIKSKQNTVYFSNELICIDSIQPYGQDIFYPLLSMFILSHANLFLDSSSDKIKNAC